ncbi:MAG: hypothetical protein L0241_21050 [Planctomycetia bacterium]|nr:hypothetical protein [Planctomycetia bacterium]
MGKRRGGPVPKLTPEKQKVIVDSIAAGLPRSIAAMRAGITERCLYQWLAKGRKGGKRNEEFVQLFQALQKAEGDAVARNVALIQKAAATTWQAAAWWLERRYPEEFGANRHELVMLRRELTELRVLFAEMTRGANPSATPEHAEPRSESA